MIARSDRWVRQPELQSRVGCRDNPPGNSHSASTRRRPRSVTGKNAGRRQTLLPGCRSAGQGRPRQAADGQPGQPCRGAQTWWSRRASKGKGKGKEGSEGRELRRWQSAGVWPARPENRASARSTRGRCGRRRSVLSPRAVRRQPRPQPIRLDKLRRVAPRWLPPRSRQEGLPALARGDVRWLFSLTGGPDTTAAAPLIAANARP